MRDESGLEKAYSARPGDLQPKFKATNCTCSFCLLVFSLDDPSEHDLSIFLIHLWKKHGLKLGEPER